MRENTESEYPDSDDELSMVWSYEKYLYNFIKKSLSLWYFLSSFFFFPFFVLQLTMLIFLIFSNHLLENHFLSNIYQLFRFVMLGAKAGFSLYLFKTSFQSWVSLSWSTSHFQLLLQPFLLKHQFISDSHVEIQLFLFKVNQ